MNKYIVTTTINSPTEATIKYSEKQEWKLIVVGDTSTPHDLYRKDVNCIYLSPETQSEAYPDLSESIGWKTIQRRNIGLVEAYRRGADVVATVDDDNIPYDSWGEDLLVGREIEVDLYDCEVPFFDPLSVTNHSYLWHRGYPLQLLQERHKVNYAGKTKRHVLVQADLWDGDPDIDAMARLTHKPLVKFDTDQPYCSNKPSPFNSQNTFLHRSVLPYYAVLPFVGRMDDIWGGYLTQSVFADSVVYNRASVYQDRNPQDLITNLENEIIGYRNTLDFLYCRDLSNLLPAKTMQFLMEYSKAYK